MNGSVQLFTHVSVLPTAWLDVFWKKNGVTTKEKLFPKGAGIAAWNQIRMRVSVWGLIIRRHRMHSGLIWQTNLFLGKKPNHLSLSNRHNLILCLVLLSTTSVVLTLVYQGGWVIYGSIPQTTKNLGTLIGNRIE